ncbi:MAG TPA: DUF748 domain-containing protein [Candidatus Omnitrophota bacterium]|nr:DUF748 domain-containing protein [Candidatus Omnitrophota bacterium]
MLKKILLGLLAFIVLILVFHSFIIGVIVKPQVESQVSKILGTDVKFNALSVRLWPGNATVYGFKIKNPIGFSDDYLLDLGSAGVSLDVPGLIKQFTAGGSEPKTIVIEHVKIKGLKFLFERGDQTSKPISNVDKLIENINASQPAKKEEAASEKPEKTDEAKPMDIRIELKQFSFKDGRVTLKDSTIGKGFEYVVDNINIDVENIFYPAKPASELVETVGVAADLGKQNPGTVHFKGRSNFMAGPNLDSELTVEGVSLADFNAFISDQPFEMKAGTFDLKSTIKILDNQLTSQHQMKLSSTELGAQTGGAKLMDIPMQTVLAALNRLPSLDVPFEVSGDLKNPQFKVTQAIRVAIANAIQKVLAGGLGDLKGLADNLQGQALGIAGENTEKLAGDAKKLVEGLAGEGSESLDEGIKKLSGMLGKMKKSE